MTATAMAQVQVPLQWELFSGRPCAPEVCVHGHRCLGAGGPGAGRGFGTGVGERSAEVVIHHGLTCNKGMIHSNGFPYYTNLFHSTVKCHTFQMVPLPHQLISLNNQPSHCKGFYHQLISLDNQLSPCKGFLYHTNLFHSTINRHLAKGSSTINLFHLTINRHLAKGSSTTNLFHLTINCHLAKGSSTTNLFHLTINHHLSLIHISEPTRRA